MPTSTVFLISGKRFSGKDTFANILNKQLLSKGKTATILSSSQELKRRFCQKYDLNFEKFLEDREYKEQYRIKLADFVSKLPPEENLKHFLEKVQSNVSNFDFIIVSDIRSKIDFDNLKKSFHSITVRILVDEKIRRSRGFKESDYDRSEFETSLDNEKFDFEIENNCDLEQLSKVADHFLKTFIGDRTT